MSLRNAVAGIDVGYSKKRRSSAVCLMRWDDESINWEIRRYRATDKDRLETIRDILGNQSLRAVAFDGPLRTGFDTIGEYRTAERILTRSFGARIGKPGQSNSPVGIRLNEETNKCVKIVLSVANVAQSASRIRIADQSVVEAFPSSYLGVMIAEPESLSAVRKNRSDKFFAALNEDGTLASLLRHLLPHRRTLRDLREVENHDDRASLICAISALSFAVGKFCAVGDENGWIILPPHAFIQPWAHDLLREGEINGVASGWFCRD
ncbi:hypothetical protein [Bradyrhizobium sp.]|jgi:Protein of unknown function (DUF429)|uniref:hypothetical protein n=1 Tax=Bradyrhizobium sp. TaxID=376 RepID=UPI003C155C17